MALLASLNGTLTPLDDARISVFDRGFMFGDGAYEVVRIYRGRPFLLDEHLARLSSSLAALRIAGTGIDTASLRAEAERVIAAAAVTEGTLYLQVTRGAPAIPTRRAHAFSTGPEPVQNPFEDAFPPLPVPPTTFLYAMALTADHTDKRRSGCPAITFPDLRWARCDIKSINLLGNVFAAQAATEAGAYEAILLKHGFVTEGSHTNVFAVVGGTLRTMPAGPAILSGITRAHVLFAARAAAISVEERALGEFELRGASEVFLTGTTTEVMPLVSLDHRPIGDGKPGTVTRRLQMAYEAEIAAFVSTALVAGR